MSTWKVLIMCLVAIIFIVGLSVLNFVCNKATKHADSIANNAVVNYEEFQELYNTCVKINTDIGVIQSLPEADKMFEQFSKAQRISTLQIQLNRWVQDYNAKSKMWNRSLWKSDKLPYQLSVTNFSNY